MKLSMEKIIASPLQSYDIRYKLVHKEDTELNDRIYSLGKAVLPTMPTADELHGFTKRHDGCEGVVEAITVDNQFVGFAHTLHFFNVSFINLMAVEPEWQDRGIGTLLLQHVEKYNANPVALTVEPAMSDSKDLKECIRRKLFYERNGYQCIPMSMLTHWDNAYDVYFKPDLDLNICRALLKKVGMLWMELELKRLNPTYYN